MLGTASPTPSPTPPPTPNSPGATTAPTKATTTAFPTAVPTTQSPTVEPQLQWSDWSVCSAVCGHGVRFRTSQAGDVVTEACVGADGACQGCDPEFDFADVVTGFNKPMSVAFHPQPGLHLGMRSEGRDFSILGGEAWVGNAGNHSITIVTGIGAQQTATISRRDRGYYHYNTNIFGLSFNKEKETGRDADKDSFGFFATCQNNPNDYLQTKGANFFMGPSLYDSNPLGGSGRNLVNLAGEQCSSDETCFFLHTDMLHEAPNCVGIVHDPENKTKHGNVYWEIDGMSKQLGELGSTTYLRRERRGIGVP